MNVRPSQKIMLSAVQPSHQLTLGNYLGALKNWIKLQHDYECIFFAVDLHALTVKRDPAQLKEQTYQAVATYIASGIHPDQAILFIQSHVPEHAELSWILNCFTYMGELGRMTQYKDKSTQQGKNIPAGLFTYPVLMAADILLYQTHLVPVGEDQKQHLEITRDLAIRINHLYGENLFTVPEIYSPPIGARIMSLQNPQIKMSKSDPDPNGVIYLMDSDDQIKKKFKRAVTDSGQEIIYRNDQPGIKNLIDISCALTGKTPEEWVNQYRGKQYGHLKIETADRVIETIAPIRSKTAELLKDRNYLDALLKQGAHRAREKAQRTLSRVYDKIGCVGGRY